MNATRMIETLSSLEAKLGARMTRLQIEIASASKQWEGLGRAGGQRDDHACEMMRPIASQLEELARLATTAHDLMTDRLADPFGE